MSWGKALLKVAPMFNGRLHHATVGLLQPPVFWCTRHCKDFQLGQRLWPVGQGLLLWRTAERTLAAQQQRRAGPVYQMEGENLHLKQLCLRLVWLLQMECEEMRWPRGLKKSSDDPARARLCRNAAESVLHPNSYAKLEKRFDGTGARRTQLCLSETWLWPPCFQGGDGGEWVPEANPSRCTSVSHSNSDKYGWPGAHQQRWGVIWAEQ